MSALIFDEQYGYLTRPQRAAYRKHNVSPMDHDMLVAEFGDNHDAITRAVKDRSTSGTYRHTFF